MISVLNLKGLREKIGWSQEELVTRINSIAKREEASQSTISKYESNPDNIPAKLAHYWAKALGLNSIYEDDSDGFGSIMVDPGTPYMDIEKNLDLIRGYVKLCSTQVSEQKDGDFTVKKLEELLKNIKERRKPNVVLLGEYDVGKSFLVNHLLGYECIPTNYQPMTRIPSLIIHTDDRPATLDADVYLLSRDFNPANAYDEKHIRDCTILAGGMHLLKDYGSHRGIFRDDKSVDFALLYLNAPLLKACNIIDAPGYEGGKEDEDKIERLSTSIDVLLYMSMAKGFMKVHDIQRFAHLWGKTTSYGNATFRKMANIMLVASQAGPSIKEKDLTGQDGILSIATARIIENIPDTVNEQSQRFGDITEDDLRRCAFPFWAEDECRYKGLRDNFRHVVATLIPQKVRESADRMIIDFKSAAHSSIAAAIDRCQAMIKDIEKMKAHYRSIVEKEPERIKYVADSKKLIESNIDLYKGETLLDIEEEYGKLINEDKLAQFIEDEFKEKKNANEYAVLRIMDKLKAEVTKIARVRADKLSKLINDFISDYETKALALYPKGMEEGQSVSMPFDMKGAFLGGIAAAGTFGALAAWVATLGNLGGYILVAKAAGIAAALGIPVGSGGAAAWIAAVAAIGGPVVIGIGLALLAGAIIWAIFGDTWQVRLAKKICSSFKEENILGKFKAWGEKYWDDTKKAFQSGSEELEKEYQKKLAEMKDLVEEQSAEDLDKTVQNLKALTSFFANIPWKSAS